MLNKKSFFFFNLFVICICLYFITSIFLNGYLHPVEISETSSFNTLIENHTVYTSLTSDHLYYSGLDASQNGRVVGNYYFSFNNGVCQFYLLKAEDNPAATKTVARLHGTILEYSHKEYATLLSQLSKKLHLDETDLSTYTSKALFSELHTSPIPSLAVYCILITGASICILSELKKAKKQKHIFN